MEDYYRENEFLLDELFALRSDLWESTCLPMEINNSSSNLYCNCFGEIPLPSTTTTSFEDYYNNFPIDQSQNYSLLHSELYSTQKVDVSSPLELTNSFNSPFTFQLEDFSSIYFDVGNFGDCKLERTQSTASSAAIAPANFNIGICLDKKAKTKKVNGEPSKNLMAERRRRKKAQWSTSILGDTIDYTKELLEKINNLQQEMELGSNQLSLMSIFKNEKPIEMFVKNSPKFNVERRNNIDTRVEINCASKSNLLLSTLTTLDALGLEPQQCVISCFNDFAMQASCYEEMEQRGVTKAEEIKQALFINAGYAGKCL
ncbi:hypothetical protein H5410_063149 [Solanum commersonii]|uniref:Plant bHLH transcription factor ACT-like domain-containing protein n=1 Tax=Solanum commersonii TaxID=4109 RepID=A0A9J5WDI8_SOLCO|nr:hypothetical protein H5410_063149 [Solanum commersonii]